MSTPILHQWKDGNWFADIDGKRIARKSIFTAHVYKLDKFGNLGELFEYKSRIEHCGSCLSERDEGYNPMDECCCIHAPFHSKKQENEYIKSIGFWKIPLPKEATND